MKSKERNIMKIFPKVKVEDHVEEIINQLKWNE